MYLVGGNGFCYGVRHSRVTVSVAPRVEWPGRQTQNQSTPFSAGRFFFRLVLGYRTLCSSAVPSMSCGEIVGPTVGFVNTDG
jgi:hypothetical protein